MGELVKIDGKRLPPEAPKEWDYEKSVGEMKPRIYKWGKLTLEMADELWVAREKLSKPGRPWPDKITDKNLPVKTWASYCQDIGITKSTANNWLRAIFGGEKRAKQVTCKGGGTARVIHGDCIEVLGKMDDTFSLMVADPPYNVMDVEWDRIGTREEYLDFMQAWIQLAIDRMFAPWHAFIFCSPSYMADVERLLGLLGHPPKSRIIWHHGNMSMGRDIQEKLISTWEPIFHIGEGKLNLPEEWGKERFDVQIEAAPQTNFDDAKVHQTQKPLELIKWLVQIGSKEGESIIDPFGGGGTTAHAAIEEGRHCVVIEKSRGFVDVIEKRIGHVN